MRRLLIYFAALLSLVSCEYTFKVNIKSHPGIYLQCIATPEGTTLAYYYAAPAGGNVEDIPEFEPTKKEVFIAGEAIEVGDKRFLPGVKPGEKIEVHLEADGLKSVSSWTTMPSEPELEEIILGDEYMAGVRIKSFEFRLKRQPSENEFYAVKIRKQTPDTSIVVRPSLVLTTNPEIELAQVELWFNHLIPSENPTLTVIPGKAFKNASLTLTDMDMSEIKPILGEESQENQEEEPPVLEADTAIYQFDIYSISESFYRYSLASYKAQTDFLAKMGLAPANFAWTNVSDGFGVCAAINGFTTDWYNGDGSKK